MPPYSARNPIPNAKKLADDLQKRLNLQKRKAGDEKDDQLKAKSRRQVLDPTTKANVVIEDVKGDFEKSIRRPEVTNRNSDPLIHSFDCALTGHNTFGKC